MQHYKWPSIEQFRNVVKHVQHKEQYVGKDENGSPIIDRSANLPTLKFEGTVKLHGTNAAVCKSSEGEVWFQSRERIITPEQDNAGFALFASQNLQDFENIFKNLPNQTALVYGEWCGGNIQKGVAISQLPKMFVVFGITLISGKEFKHLSKQQVVELTRDCRVSKCIYSFKTFELDIDFENPHESQNTLNAITEAIEAECPVGAALGAYGVGEGVVWRCVEQGFESSDFWFKVKGEKHSSSKVKTLATVDVAKIEGVNNLAKLLANNGRLEQMVQQVFDTLNGGEIDLKRTGEFIKAVMSDVVKEEVDTILENGFTVKELSGPIGKLSRDFLLNHLTT